MGRSDATLHRRYHPGLDRGQDRESFPSSAAQSPTPPFFRPNKPRKVITRQLDLLLRQVRLHERRHRTRDCGGERPPGDRSVGSAVQPRSPNPGPLDHSSSVIQSPSKIRRRASSSKPLEASNEPITRSSPPSPDSVTTNRSNSGTSVA